MPIRMLIYAWRNEWIFPFEMDVRAFVLFAICWLKWIKNISKHKTIITSIQLRQASKMSEVSCVFANAIQMKWNESIRFYGIVSWDLIVFSYTVCARLRCFFVCRFTHAFHRSKRHRGVSVSLYDGAHVQHRHRHWLNWTGLYVSW